MDWRRPFRRSAPATAPAGELTPLEHARALVLAYHERTKHAPQHFARGPGHLDWDTQPDPFRTWEGCERLALAHPAPDSNARYAEVFVPGALAPRPLDPAFIAELFYDSLALSAWKRAGDARWSLRVNPSSGNLHPTEAYLVAPAIAGLSATPFVAHYAPRTHELELRTRLSSDLWTELASELAPGSVIVALTSIPWREAWKYGERAYRYCQHDVGHALAGLTLAAAALGWRVTLLEGLGTADITTLLQLGASAGPEVEEAELALALHSTGECGAQLSAQALARFPALEWRGTPNALSPDHVDWEVIEAVARAAAKPRTALAARDRSSWPTPEVPAVTPPPRAGPVVTGLPDPAVAGEPASLRRIVRQRRSAVAMDARTSLTQVGLLRALQRTLPVAGAVPWTALAWSPRVHLALFVNRVQGLEPGLYLWLRTPADESALRSALRPEFRWERPAAAGDLPLWCLRPGDVRGIAAHISCDQTIAGDGCFSLAMIARVGTSIATDGAWMYPRLYWECGAIGQALYLEAEDLGLRATGIGCFYDDSVHALLGLSGREWQSLYHFTVGGALEDQRIVQEPAYPAGNPSD